MHHTLEMMAVGLAFVSILALAYGYRRGRSPRLLLALLAFGVLSARSVALILLHTLYPMGHFVEEVVNFGGDLGAMALFALAFLYRPGESHDGSLSQPA